MSSNNNNNDSENEYRNNNNDARACVCVCGFVTPYMSRRSTLAFRLCCQPPMKLYRAHSRFTQCHDGDGRKAGGMRCLKSKSRRSKEVYMKFKNGEKSNVFWVCAKCHARKHNNCDNNGNDITIFHFGIYICIFI